MENKKKKKCTVNGGGYPAFVSKLTTLFHPQPVFLFVKNFNDDEILFP